MTRRKKQIKKSALMIIILTILISIGLYFLLFSKSTGGLLVRSKDTTAKFDYTLDKDNTNLMKENFKELKDILANDNINYEDYAKTLAKLFIIDLYTIDNKKSMYDVGSLEYVYDKENFKTRCQNTLYRGLNDKSTRKNNEYPIVESINIDSFENGEFTYNDNKYESYEITLSWDYKKDLGYDKKGKVTIIKIEDKLYVVSYEGGEK
jgi:hypothetical protein